MPRLRSLLFALAVGCAATGTSTPQTAAPTIASSPTDREIEGLAPAAVVRGDTKPLDKALDAYFAAASTRRAYLMTEKPSCQPGETIWFRADLRATTTLLGGAPTGMNVQLVSPRGAIVAQKRVLVQNGVARNDFELSSDIEGGEYSLQLAADTGTTDT